MAATTTTTTKSKPSPPPLLLLPQPPPPRVVTTQPSSCSTTSPSLSFPMKKPPSTTTTTTIAAATTKSRLPQPLPRIVTNQPSSCSTSLSSLMKLKTTSTTTTAIAAATTTTTTTTSLQLQRLAKRLLFLLVLLQLHNAHPPYFFFFNNDSQHHRHNHRSSFSHACWRPHSSYHFHVDNETTATLSYGCTGDGRHVWMTCECWGAVPYLYFIRLKQFIPRYGQYSMHDIRNPWTDHRPDKNSLISMDNDQWKLMYTASVAGWTALTFPSSGYRLVKMGYGGRLVALTMHVPFDKTNPTNTSNTNNIVMTLAGRKSGRSKSDRRKRTTTTTTTTPNPTPPTEDTVPENYGYYFCEVMGLSDGKRVVVPSLVIHVTKDFEHHCQNQAL